MHNFIAHFFIPKSNKIATKSFLTNSPTSSSTRTESVQNRASHSNITATFIDVPTPPDIRTGYPFDPTTGTSYRPTAQEQYRVQNQLWWNSRLSGARNTLHSLFYK